ncbi:MAG: protein-tyrosine-phosphatase [Bryobacteraceae bacterium]|jgi:protein tyrosine/serine phosphatase
MLYRRLVPGLLALSLSIAGLPAASIPDIPGVDNFHQVDEHVYRGAQPHGDGYAGLAKIGIKTVIDLRGENSEGTFVQRAGMRYVRLRWSGYKAPDESQVAAVMAVFNDPSAWPVFVHCRRGADRTGTAIACYRIEHDHWTSQQALTEAKAFGMSSLEIAMQHFILGFSAPAAATNLASTTAVSPSASPALQPAP